MKLARVPVHCTMRNARMKLQGTFCPVHIHTSPLVSTASPQSITNRHGRPRPSLTPDGERQLTGPRADDARGLGHVISAPERSAVS